jgi:hypothetical protein
MAEADHVAIHGRAESRSRGRAGDVRGASRTRSRQEVHETLSSMAGAGLRGP